MVSDRSGRGACVSDARLIFADVPDDRQYSFVEEKQRCPDAKAASGIPSGTGKVVS